MGDNPGSYHDGRTLSVKLSGATLAKLATYQREMHPGRSLEQVADYLVRDSLVRLGLLDLPSGNRSKGARG
jgi:hypothetical protein